MLQETGYNLTKVAEKLNVVQSAVSRQLLMLEDEIGNPLLERHGKRILGPTPLGELVLAEAGSVKQAKKNIRSIADDFLENRVGTLHIATTHTQAKYFLPKPISQFREKYPQVKIYIEQSSPGNLTKFLYQHKADIVICTETLEENDKLTVKSCYQWHHMAIVPKGHVLADSQITLESLAAFPILTYTRGFTGRSNIEKAFNNAGIVLDITLAAADSDVIKTYVRLGYGVGIIAGIAYEPTFDSDLVAISLKDLIPASITKFAYLKQSYLPKFTRYYIDQLLSSTPEINENPKPRATTAKVSDESINDTTSPLRGH